MLLPIKRALLSVTDKSGLDQFASFLSGSGAELVSTGGTKKKLVESGLEVTSVSSVTGFPEMLGGRVKTLHPRIHAGILADKEDREHVEVMDKLSIAFFDLVCVNLYNFALAVEKGLELREAVEQIDIGGPTLLRAAAKNFHSVLVVPSPEHYKRVEEDMEKNGGKVSLELRKEMAAETFRLVSRYDSMIAEYLGGKSL